MLWFIEIFLLVVGINKIGGIPSVILLPNLKSDYSFRRMSATFLIDSEDGIMNLKQRGGWKTSSIVAHYIAE